jgi:hypothetical protein
MRLAAVVLAHGFERWAGRSTGPRPGRSASPARAINAFGSRPAPFLAGEIGGHGQLLAHSITSTFQFDNFCAIPSLSANERGTLDGLPVAAGSQGPASRCWRRACPSCCRRLTPPRRSSQHEPFGRRPPPVAADAPAAVPRPASSCKDASPRRRACAIREKLKWIR